MAHPFKKSDPAAFHNYLLSKYEMYRGEATVASVPYCLSIDPSDRCQLQCPTCATGIENASRRDKSQAPIIFRDDRKMLGEDLFDSLINELGERLLMIMFYNWGEPLLNKKLPSFIRKATERDIYTEIHTNLSLPLPDERIDEVIASGLTSLNASVDGFSQQAYEINRIGGNIELIKYNLERFAERRAVLGSDMKIIYNFLVFAFNEHEIDATAEYCSQLDITFNPRDAIVNDPEWLPSYRKGEKGVWLPEIARSNPEHEYVWSPLNQPADHPVAASCGWHYGYSIVSAGGHLSPCCAVPKSSEDFGTVVPEVTSFHEVWNDDRLLHARSAFGNPELDPEGRTSICGACPFPPALPQLYSIHDALIISRFAEISEAFSEPVKTAFDLLSKARYGLSLSEMNDEHLHKTAARAFDYGEYPEDAEAFVQYYATYCRKAVEFVSP